MSNKSKLFKKKRGTTKSLANKLARHVEYLELQLVCNTSSNMMLPTFTPAFSHFPAV